LAEVGDPVLDGDEPGVHLAEPALQAAQPLLDRH
jgi:hypothetical protein